MSPVYIAGIALAGTLVLGLAVWLSIRTYRQRARARREAIAGGTFLSVRGLVRETGDVEKSALPEAFQATQGTTFSRDNLTSSIVLPNKAITRPTAELREDILEYHRQSGTFPRPFAPRPFSFALSAGSPSPTGRPSTLNPDGSSLARDSFMSVSSSYSRFSVMSSNSSVISSPTTGSTRKVRQLFSPVLPDELLLGRLGEKLVVVQSFDDGWVVVGRENNLATPMAKSLFKSPSGPPVESNIEMGVVPAWCFLKPVKGLRAERPVRSSSLGITVQMDGPGFSSRDEIMSWSNF